MLLYAPGSFAGRPGFWSGNQDVSPSQKILQRSRALELAEIVCIPSALKSKVRGNFPLF